MMLTALFFATRRERIEIIFEGMRYKALHQDDFCENKKIRCDFNLEMGEIGSLKSVKRLIQNSL